QMRLQVETYEWQSRKAGYFPEHKVRALRFGSFGPTNEQPEVFRFMRGKSHIEWTVATWNPVTGCSKVSAGCKNCYAERMANRLQAMGNPRYLNGFKLTLHKDLIDLPRHWREPRLIFVNSMSDLFHEEVPLEFI